jgi:integrase
MPPRPKGPRLYLRRGRADKRTQDVWVIRDGSAELSTGCGASRLGDAERALAEYIAEKWRPQKGQGSAERSGDPASVYVAEVVALYSLEKAPKVQDPGSAKVRLEAIMAWWGDKTLADVKRSTCEAYVAHRKTQPIKSFTRTTPRMVTAQGARRELEDLSAAIGYWDGEHRLTRLPKVTLPEKPESPRDALTRPQVAGLLKAALGWRLKADGTWIRLQGAAAANRRHLRRFILIGVYTGTRPGVIPKLLWHESPTQAWVDLEDGVIYRRGKDEKDHKTKRRPMVRMPPRLLAHMRRWKAEDEKVQQLQDDGEHAATKRRAKPAQRPRTVLHHGGRPLAGRIRKGFANIVSDAGLDGEITPHWMRHTCATWLMERGVKVWDAAAYTGMSTATLEKHYGHHRPDHQKAARKALGANNG